MTEEKLQESMIEAMLEYPVRPMESVPLTVKRCIIAMSAERDRAVKEGATSSERRKRAQIAYKLFMPALEDRESVKAYIACVAHGITLKVFNGRDASQMLYAAQVALSLIRQQPKEPGRPRVAARPTKQRRAA